MTSKLVTSPGITPARITVDDGDADPRHRRPVRRRQRTQRHVTLRASAKRDASAAPPASPTARLSFPRSSLSAATFD